MTVMRTGSTLPLALACLVWAVGSSACSKESNPPQSEPKPAEQAIVEAPTAAPAPAPEAAPAKGPLRIAYSDWPGWVAWEIGIQKGWFKEEGVDVDFKWFEYVPSMEAFSAGKVDAVTMTNGDAEASRSLFR